MGIGTSKKNSIIDEDDAEGTRLQKQLQNKWRVK